MGEQLPAARQHGIEPPIEPVVVDLLGPDPKQVPQGRLGIERLRHREVRRRLAEPGQRLDASDERPRNTLVSLGHNAGEELIQSKPR